MKKIIKVLFIGYIALSFLSCSKGKEQDQVIETGVAAKGDSGYSYRLAAGRMEIQWSVKGKNLHVRLKGKTSGWIAAGFNPTEGMKDANFIMGFVKDGKVELSNHYGVSKFIHKNAEDLGGKSYIMNPAGSLKDNETEISFEYPLSTGGKHDRPIDVNGDTILLLAMAQTSFISQQHMFRAKISVNLANGNYTVLKKSGN